MKFVRHKALNGDRWKANRVLASLILFSAGLLPFVDHAQSRELVATTGDPVAMDLGDGVVMPALTLAEYQKQAATLSKSPNFVPIRKFPPNLSPQAKYGYNFKLADSRILSWILDGNDSDGYILIADTNGNGDLSDDERLPFRKQAGNYSLVFRFTAQDARSNESFPVVYTVRIEKTNQAADTVPHLSVRRFNTTFQRGVIRVKDRQIAFGIVANAGAGRRAIFDLNGDGELDLSENSPEAFDVAEEIVRIGEQDFRFKIDQHGRELVLEPLAQNRPATTVLRAGYPAPNFTFTDLEGHAHQLSEYRGKVVLVDFWSTSCGACLESLPLLLKTYAKYQASGFEILGIDGDDSAEVLRAFVTDKKISWPQINQEKFDGALHKQFRFEAWPTYYLIGRNGIILARSMGSDGFLAKLPEFLHTN